MILQSSNAPLAPGTAHERPSLGDNSPVELPHFDSFIKTTQQPLPAGELLTRALPDEQRIHDASLDAHPLEIVDLHAHGDRSPSLSSPSTSPPSSPMDTDDLVYPLASLSVSPRAQRQQHAARAHSPEYLMRRTGGGHGKKKYLTEEQRYSIVCRVLAGERQAKVAREFGVTRAAVSYLLKHHAEIMQRVLMLHAHCYDLPQEAAMS